MLSVQSVNNVNLSNRLAFKGGVSEPEAYKYSRDAYESDKSKLEEHLDEVNAIIEDVNVPKPVRAFGKIVSIGIGAALGFVSMKFGAQGMAKLFKKGAGYVKSVVNKPTVQNAAHKTAEVAQEAAEGVKKHSKSLFGKIGEFVKNNKVIQKGVNFVKNNKVTKAVVKFIKLIVEKFKTSKLGKKVIEYAGKFNKSVKKAAADVKAKAGNVTSEKVENAAVNVFAISGGVSGGITALQETVKED